MRRTIYTFGRRPATRTHVAEQLYQSVRRHKTSNSDTLPFPTSWEAVEPNHTKMYGAKGHTGFPTPKPLPISTAQQTIWRRLYCAGCLTITTLWCCYSGTSLMTGVCLLVESLSTPQPCQSTRHHYPKHATFHTPAFDSISYCLLRGSNK